MKKYLVFGNFVVFLLTGGVSVATLKSVLMVDLQLSKDVEVTPTDPPTKPPTEPPTEPITDQQQSPLNRL